MRRGVDMCVWELKERAGIVVTLKHTQNRTYDQGNGV